MSALAEQQAALVAALGVGPNSQAAALLAGHLEPSATWERGLRAYRSNAALLAERVLAGTCPRAAALLGEENFGPLARRLWREQPPARGDLAQWGAGFADLLAGIPDIAADQPGLPDVARVEWALHRAATAADARQDPDSFVLLAREAPDNVRLRLAPGLRWLASGHPVVALLLEEQAATGGPQTALIWRQALRPRLRAARPGEPAFLASAVTGAALSQALDAGGPDFDFAAWLSPAVQEGLLLGVTSSADHLETP